MNAQVESEQGTQSSFASSSSSSGSSSEAERQDASLPAASEDKRTLKVTPTERRSVLKKSGKEGSPLAPGGREHRSYTISIGGDTAGAAWNHGMKIESMLDSLRSDAESLTNVVRKMEDFKGHKTGRAKAAIDFRRMEILSRLLEMLSERSYIGVLQSSIVTMFVDTYHEGMPALLYSPEDIEIGCTNGPSVPLHVAIEAGVDDRLVVTIETFEGMVSQIPNYELALLLDDYSAYIQAMEMAWQVATLEKPSTDMRHEARIKNASGIAVFGVHAYIADSEQHMIFRVNIITDEIVPFVGIRNKPGFHDGPRELAKFNAPSGLAICDRSSTLYVCDTGNDMIRMVNIISGNVHHIHFGPTDPETTLVAPMGICIVRGDFDYDKDGSDDDDDDDDEGEKVSHTSESLQDDDDDDGDGLGRKGYLEGITEEDEDLYDMYDGQNMPKVWTDGITGAAGRRKSQSSARYALASAEPWAKPLGLGRSHMSKGQLSRNFPKSSESAMSSRRTSSYMSSHPSRRTSGYYSNVSSVSSRRTSHLSVTTGASAKDSLRECTEEGEEIGQNLAVTSDHCVFFIRPEKAEIMLLAGSRTKYGYRDADKGPEARFSSLKGITAIRNSLFVADHWNNAIRCINLKTRHVDTVVDFNPHGPIALTVSGSGSVYVLDSEVMSVCNMLKICSFKCSDKDGEGALGTTAFQMMQDSIGRSRSNSKSKDDFLIDAMQRRGSAAKVSRSASMSSDASDEVRRCSYEKPPWACIKTGNDEEGSIAALGPRMRAFSADGATNRPSHVGDDRWPAFQSSVRPSVPNGLDAGDPDIDSVLPVVPHALRSLIPGTTLHPALIQMTLRNRSNTGDEALRSGFTGSQFHVSVASSVANDEFEDTPEFFSFLNPKHESPWKKIPIGTMPYVFQEATGQPSANTPLSLGVWDAAVSEEDGLSPNRHSQQLILGAAQWPSVIKVLPPRKASAQDIGRFRAVVVDIDRVIMADSSSNQIFVVNHTRRTKEKIAGCGKPGYLDGPLDVCRMNQPSSVALDPSTHYIYVADSGNHRIRCIDLSTGFMRTVCGSGVKGNIDSADMRLQQLDSPFDLHFMQPYYLLITCSDNSIRRLDLQTSQLDTLLVGS